MSGSEPLLLSDYKPRPKLVTPVTTVSQPRFPTIDAHNHLGPEFGGNWIARPLSELIDILDRCHIQRLVDLDGGWGEDILAAHLDHFKAPYPERFIIFGGVDWARWPEEGNRFPELAAKRLEAQVRRGAQGLKIWKPLGLHIKDDRGERVAIDDARLEPIWATAADLDLPVVIHIADPVAFFDPLDRFNEQYEVLQGHPDWYFYGPQFPPFQQLMDEFDSLLGRNPRTTFIGAHVGCYAENLGWVASALDRHPNFYIDIAARINEIGRQPYTARDLFLRYPDRILFGTDAPANDADYGLYFRFLETRDEYFKHCTGEGFGLGRWYIYGLYLPDEVLEKVYHRNAEHLILHLE